MKNNIDLFSKLESLKSALTSMESVAVAFSGGVDSTFLLKVAKDVLGKKVVAVTLKSPVFSSREMHTAITIAEGFKINHIFIESGLLDDPGFLRNDKMRCYLCKKSGFSKIIEFASQKDFAYVIDGQNLDDLSDYRPGSKAAEELGVKSPLKDAKLKKQEIRNLSRWAGIDGWDRPALACLASRIPYGIKITKNILEKIDKLETFLELKGFSQSRVRHYGETVRIELLKEEFPLLLDNKILAGIVSEFKKSGYTYVTLDIEGYRTGSLNEVLNEEDK